MEERKKSEEKRWVAFIIIFLYQPLIDSGSASDYLKY